MFILMCEILISSQELFVQYLALSSYKNGSGRETNTLSYSDLANAAEETETFQFLTGESWSFALMTNSIQTKSSGV